MRSPLTALLAAGLVLLVLASFPRAGQEVDASEHPAPQDPPELEALLSKLAADPPPAGEAKARLLMDTGGLLQDLGRHTEAVTYLQEGADLARSLDSQNLLVVNLGNLAGSCFFLGEYRRGLEACNEALAVAQVLKRSDHVWRLANTCGAVNLRLADYSAALEAFELALAHAPPDEPGALGLIHSNLGTAYMHVGEFARADEQLDLALPLLTEHAPPIYASAVHATRADLRVLQEEFEAALPLQEEALRIRREAGAAAEPEVAQSLVGLGRIHSGLGDLKRAEEVLLEALAIQRRLGLQGDQVATLGVLAEVYAHQGRGEEGQQAALAGLELADEIHVLGQRVETLHSLASVLEAEGDPQQALAVLREALALEREISTLDVRERTAALEESIKLADAAAELAAERELRLQDSVELAQAATDLHAEREHRRTQLAWLASLGGGLALCAALLGWALYWSKRRSLRALDLVNAELSAAGAAATLRSRELESALSAVHGLEEERIRSGQLELLGILAGGIAHDFNNALMAVLGHISLAQRCLPARSDALVELEASEAAAEQAARLSRQLLQFAKGGEPVRAPCALGPLAREAASLAATGSGIVMRLDLPGDLWPVVVDRSQFQRVVTNLVLNAVHATPSGGTVTLSARNLPAGAPGRPADPAVEIRVEDSGPGIPDELRDQVFTAGFSTKSKGSGFGLSIVKSIVTSSRGTVRLERGRTGGALFVVELPAAPDALPPILPAGAAEELPLGPARILALDDEPPVRELYQRMLARLGLEVVLAGDGPTALAEFERARAQRRPFDLLVFDLTLPGGMNGVEVLAAVHRIDARALAIVASGYSDSEVFEHPERGGFVGALGKPFTLELLARAIRSALALRAGPAVDGAERPAR